MSRLVAAPPPNRVRSPTDRQFASGCSPRRFEPTQLPLATELWHTPTRTFTVQMWRPHGRTHPRMFLSGVQFRTRLILGLVADIHIGDHVYVTPISRACWNEDHLRLIPLTRIN